MNIIVPIQTRVKSNEVSSIDEDKMDNILKKWSEFESFDSLQSRELSKGELKKLEDEEIGVLRGPMYVSIIDGFYIKFRLVRLPGKNKHKEDALYILSFHKNMFSKISRFLNIEKK